MSKKWLVFVEIEGKRELFGFSTKKGRDQFLSDIRKKFPGIQYATSVNKEKVND